MKQLSIRLVTPLGLAGSIVSRIIHFSSRKISLITTAPQRLVGKWRLYLNYCPECNSCGHKEHQCDVCHGDTKSYFAWNKEIERTWWKRYADKHHFVA